jgi:hypothetical protein
MLKGLDTFKKSSFNATELHLENLLFQDTAKLLSKSPQDKELSGQVSISS